MVNDLCTTSTIISDECQMEKAKVKTPRSDRIKPVQCTRNLSGLMIAQNCIPVARENVPVCEEFYNELDTKEVFKPSSMFIPRQ